MIGHIMTTNGKNVELNMKPTIEINEGNFENEVLKSDRPVLVGFWATMGDTSQLPLPSLMCVSIGLVSRRSPA